MNVRVEAGVPADAARQRAREIAEVEWRLRQMSAADAVARLRDDCDRRDAAIRMTGALMRPGYGR